MFLTFHTIKISTLFFPSHCSYMTFALLRLPLPLSLSMIAPHLD